MVTLKVQRWPIPDYFMAYFLQHPEGNANIYSRTRSSPPRPTGTATLPPINVRRHCTCLPTVSLYLKTPKGTKKNLSSLITVNVLHTRLICFIGGASTLPFFAQA